MYEIDITQKTLTLEQWYVKAVMHNLIGYNLTLADPAAYVTWGSVSQQAPLLRSGQDNIPMAHWQPATGTWTGTTGVAMYKVDGPVGNKLAFGVMMPFIGDNKCSVRDVYIFMNSLILHC